jgi:acyl phosphate:glycerol-3-phosphate acyltransferase
MTFQGIILLLSYLIGSIPFGMFLSPSRSNQLIIQVLDMLKGAVPVLLLAYSGAPAVLGAALGIPGDGVTLVTPLLIWSAGFCVVLGHCFNPWLKFKGGRGVATTFGIFAVLVPIAAAIGALGFGFSYLKTKNFSICSLVGVSLSILSYMVINPVKAHVCVGIALCLIVLLRHEDSMDLLLEGKSS